MAHHHFPWRDALLHALRQMPIIRHACDTVGIDRTTLFRARKADPELDAAVLDAIEDGVDKAEQAAFERGVTGWQEPVIDKGRLAYAYERILDEEGKEHFVAVLDERGQPVPLTIRKHSDMLLSLVLKGRRKQVYAERTELTGADGAPVAIDQATAAARVSQLLAKAQARKDFSDLA